MVTAHTSGPSTIPAASSVPDAAFPTVRSAVVSEISGSSELWTGRVKVIATDPSTAATAITTVGASTASAVPRPA